MPQKFMLCSSYTINYVHPFCSCFFYYATTNLYPFLNQFSLLLQLEIFVAGLYLLILFWSTSSLCQGWEQIINQKKPSHFFTVKSLCSCHCFCFQYILIEFSVPIHILLPLFFFLMPLNVILIFSNMGKSSSVHTHSSIYNCHQPSSSCSEGNQFRTILP